MHAPLTSFARTRHEVTIQTIRDSGSGMLADLLETLFKESERADEALRRVEMLEQRVVTLELEHANLLHRLADAIPDPASPWEGGVETVVLAGECDDLT